MRRSFSEIWIEHLLRCVQTTLRSSRFDDRGRADIKTDDGQRLSGNGVEKELLQDSVWS